MSSFAVEEFSRAAMCFADLEIVSVGLSAGQAAVRGMTVIIGTFPLAASGRAMTLDEDAGFVRVVACHDVGRIVRIQAVGSHVSELSGEFALAVEMAGLLRFSQHPPQGHSVLIIWSQMGATCRDRDYPREAFCWSVKLMAWVARLELNDPGTLHAHPTLSKATREATSKASERVIHA